jgi:hypothetical protein
MTLDYKRRYDIFICGGSEHFQMLRQLLPKLYDFGTVHLASATLTDSELDRLRPHIDALHKPRHDADGYLNFNLFCIRDINRLAKAPLFIKLDADAELQDGWIEYVERGIAAHSDAVLFGIKEGVGKINIHLSGPLPRRKLGRDVRVVDGRKVIGGFYVGNTAFFKRHDRFMQIAHELLYCFEDGRRSRPTPNPEEWAGEDELPASFDLKGDYRDLHRVGNEDTLRSLVVHAVGAADRMFILDGEGMISVPHGPGFGNKGDW